MLSFACEACKHDLSDSESDENTSAHLAYALEMVFRLLWPYHETGLVDRTPQAILLNTGCDRSILVQDN